MALPNSAVAVLLALFLAPPGAQAWGDEGHATVALIARPLLRPEVAATVDAMLQSDDSGLTIDRGIAAEASWADRYRDTHPETRSWHFVDIELDSGPPDDRQLAALCEREDCVVARIEQFSRTLADRTQAPAVRLRALQFLLHLVGDLHQPLHAADAHDRGGNDRRVEARGHRGGPLHHYWDTVFVADSGADPQDLAHRLLDGISPRNKRAWSEGSPADWARESFGLAATFAYGGLPVPDGRGLYHLNARYVAEADDIVRLQLQRAGVRLAQVLNTALR